MLITGKIVRKDYWEVNCDLDVAQHSSIILLSWVQVLSIGSRLGPRPQVISIAF